ncbi:unnamed protein product, partial [Ectocarpus sp. 12 AP-2014]
NWINPQRIATTARMAVTPQRQSKGQDLRCRDLPTRQTGPHAREINGGTGKGEVCTWRPQPRSTRRFPANFNRNARSGVDFNVSDYRGRSMLAVSQVEAAENVGERSRSSRTNRGSWSVWVGLFGSLMVASENFRTYSDSERLLPSLPGRPWTCQYHPSPWRYMTTLG